MKTTDYSDINTYRMEKDPEQVRADTLALLADGVSTIEIDGMLMRSRWIENGYQMLHRMQLRAEEKKAADAWVYKP